MTDNACQTSWIAGERALENPTRFFRSNPARLDDEPLSYSAATEADLERAIAAAVSASGAWSKAGIDRRCAILRRAAAILRSRAGEVASLLMRETGKIIAECTGEVEFTAQVLEFVAASDSWGWNGTAVETTPGSGPAITRRFPLGVVAIVTPWNFPISNPCIKLAAALAAGNCVIWKPASFTAGVALELTACLAEAGLPEGVLSTVIGSGALLGGRLAQDHRIAAVSFTGSTEIGNELIQTVSGRKAKVQAELGGKNAALILDSANIAKAAHIVARAAFLFAGQKCTATSRVICTPAPRADFIEALLAEVSCIRVGDPSDPASMVGPVIDAAALSEHEAAVAMAVAEGGRVLLGGRRLDGDLARGCYMGLTVLDRVAQDAAVAQTEIFGPVLALIDAADTAEALRIANNTPYGLSASVFTQDISEALALTDELEVGAVRVNGPSSGMFKHLPMGGWKDSGFGERELGTTALNFFSHEKTIYLGV